MSEVEKLIRLMEVEINRLREENEEVRQTLEDMLYHYIDLVDSGDYGNWNPDDEEIVQKVKRLLKATSSDSTRSE